MSRPKRKSPPSVRLTLLGLFLVLGAASTVALGELFPEIWLLDMLAHFRRQATWLVGIGAGVLFLARQRGLAVGSLAAALGLAVTAYQVLPLPEGDPTRERYTLLHFNLEVGNERIPQLEAFIEELEPDVIFLCEAEHLYPELEGLFARFPYKVLHYRRTLYGQVVLSRYPIVSHEIIGRLPGARAALGVRIDLPDGRLTFIGTHAITPVSSEGFFIRNLHFDEIAPRLAAIESPLLMSGDFNCTPWSEHLSDFAREAGLTRAAPSRSALPTWPARFPLVRLPIDHIFRNEAITVTAVRRGPFLGSDHFPLVAEFQLQPR